MAGRQKDRRTAAMAAQAADRLERGAAAGEQMGLFPAPAQPAAFEPPAEARSGPGRPAGSRNKRGSQLREWIAHKGGCMPEDRLMELAGLFDRDRSALEHAFALAEQAILLSGAKPGEVEPSARLGLALQFLELGRKAVADLLPYGLPKMTPDTVQQIAATFIQMPGAGGQGGGGPVVEGAAASVFAPPPLPGEIVEDQGLSESDDGDAGGEARTE